MTYRKRFDSFDLHVLKMCPHRRPTTAYHDQLSHQLYYHDMEKLNDKNTVQIYRLEHKCLVILDFIFFRPA